MEEKLYTQSDMNAVINEIDLNTKFLQQRAANLALLLDRANRISALKDKAIEALKPSDDKSSSLK